MAQLTILTRDFPCGTLALADCDNRLCYCGIPEGPILKKLIKRGDFKIAYGLTPALTKALQWLESYFSGHTPDVDVPLEFLGTDFQKIVWSALLTIPYGSTVSYSALAAEVASPASTRAVASAVAANPLLIFVPCHRVIASNGSLSGYSAGIEMKKHLLKSEGATLI